MKLCFVGRFLGFRRGGVLILLNSLWQWLWSPTREIVGDTFLEKRARQSTISQFFREFPAWMEHIPWRLVLRRSTPAGILVAKSVDGPVPNGLELFDEHVLTKRNPNVIDQQIAHAEMFDLQIRGFFD